jgi:hypothetical protein
LRIKAFMAVRLLLGTAGVGITDEPQPAESLEERSFRPYDVGILFGRILCPLQRLRLNCRAQEDKAVVVRALGCWHDVRGRVPYAW